MTSCDQVIKGYMVLWGELSRQVIALASVMPIGLLELRIKYFCFVT